MISQLYRKKKHLPQQAYTLQEIQQDQVSQKHYDLKVYQAELARRMKLQSLRTNYWNASQMANPQHSLKYQSYYEFTSRCEISIFRPNYQAQLTKNRPALPSQFYAIYICIYVCCEIEQKITIISAPQDMDQGNQNIWKNSKTGEPVLYEQNSGVIHRVSQEVFTSYKFRGTFNGSMSNK